VEHHYRAVGSATHDQVVSALQRYAKGDPSWKDEFTWERLELSPTARSGCAGMTILAFMFLAIVTMMAA
jgi:hypothetical protein